MPGEAFHQSPHHQRYSKRIPEIKPPQSSFVQDSMGGKQVQYMARSIPVQYMPPYHIVGRHPGGGFSLPVPQAGSDGNTVVVTQSFPSKIRNCQITHAETERCSAFSPAQTQAKMHCLPSLIPSPGVFFQEHECHVTMQLVQSEREFNSYIMNMTSK